MSFCLCSFCCSCGPCIFNWSLVPLPGYDTYRERLGRVLHSHTHYIPLTPAFCSQDFEYGNYKWDYKGQIKAPVLTPAVSSVVMQSVLLTGRPFLKISMRCRYTLRKPTSSFFQARNQKCRSPSLLPRQWCAKTPSPTWRKVREPVLSLSSTICVPLVHQKYGYFHTELNFPSVNWLSCSFLPPFPSFIFFFPFGSVHYLPSFGFALLSESVLRNQKQDLWPFFTTVVQYCTSCVVRYMGTSGWERFLALTTNFFRPTCLYT